MGEREKEIEKRSERMVSLLNQIKGEDIKDFPVPPFTKWLNGQVISAKKGEVIMEMEVRKEMTNPTGLLHGGMQSAMLDDTIGVTCATLGYKGFLITIDFHADFLGKARVGEKVRVRGLIVRDGKRIVHADAEIMNEKEELIATASSNLIKTTHKPDYVKNLEEDSK